MTPVSLTAKLRIAPRPDGEGVLTMLVSSNPGTSIGRIVLDGTNGVESLHSRSRSSTTASLSSFVRPASDTLISCSATPTARASREWGSLRPPRVVGRVHGRRTGCERVSHVTLPSAGSSGARLEPLQCLEWRCRKTRLSGEVRREGVVRTRG